ADAPGVAVVAGGGHDHYAGVPDPLDGNVDRVAAVAVDRIDGQRQVDDPGVEDVAGGGHEVEGGDEAHQVGGAVGAGDLDRDQVGIGRHALDRPIGGGAGTGDEAGDEGAVPVAVAVVGFAGQVDAACHLAGEVADRVDAGVDDGDADALARCAHVPRLGRPHNIGVDGTGHAAAFTVLTGERARPVGGDGRHSGSRLERGDRRGRQRRRETVDDWQFHVDVSVEAGDRLFHGPGGLGVGLDEDGDGRLCLGGGQPDGADEQHPSQGGNHRGDEQPGATDHSKTSQSRVKSVI